MKTEQADTTSFSEYGAHLREHHERVRKTGGPLFVTGEGAEEGESEAEAVVLSRHAYEELMDRAHLPEIVAMIEKSKAQLRAGLGVSAVEARERVNETIRRHSGR